MWRRRRNRAVWPDFVWQYLYLEFPITGFDWRWHREAETLGLEYWLQSRREHWGIYSHWIFVTTCTFLAMDVEVRLAEKLFLKFCRARALLLLFRQHSPPHQFFDILSTGYTAQNGTSSTQTSSCYLRIEAWYCQREQNSQQSSTQAYSP